VALTSDLHAVWNMVHADTGVALATDMKAIGLVQGGEVVAGVLYENWNDVNVWMHIAVRPGVMVSPRWARYAFAYPFDEAGRERITAEVAAGNQPCRALIERIGFRVEAVLQGAARLGSDLLIYRLLRADCALLRPRRQAADASMAVSRIALEV
jgi:RimJ/RimL family protein N-acetyltransferase